MYKVFFTICGENMIDKHISTVVEDFNYVWKYALMRFRVYNIVS